MTKWPQTVGEKWESLVKLKILIFECLGDKCLHYFLFKHSFIYLFSLFTNLDLKVEVLVFVDR